MTLTFKQIVTRLLKHTSVVLVGGYWKTGKTNFALHIAELCILWGLISEVGTNIKVINPPTWIKYIADTQTLNSWLGSNGHLKLFLFDEGNEHLPNTGFMTSKSTGVKSIIPQISKKRARLIVIAQDIDTLDKTFRLKSWWRGTFLKVTRTKAKFNGAWNLHKPIMINDVKPTMLEYDPYVSAEWNEHPDKVVFFKDADRQNLYALTHGKTSKELGLHPQEVNRLWKKYVKDWLDNDSREAPKEENKIETI